MVDAMYKMILKQLWNERKGNLFIWLEMLVVSIFLWYAAGRLVRDVQTLLAALGL